MTTTLPTGKLNTADAVRSLYTHAERPTPTPSIDQEFAREFARMGEDPTFDQSTAATYVARF